MISLWGEVLSLEKIPHYSIPFIGYTNHGNDQDLYRIN